MPRVSLLLRSLATAAILSALPARAAAPAPADATVRERAPAPAPAGNLIRATDLLKLQTLDAPAFSPDGRWVVFVVRSIELKPNAKDDWTYRTHLWLVPSDGSAPARQLTRTGNDSAPAWHPSGDRLAFAREVEGAPPQLYVLPLAGGEAQPLTKLETGAGRPRWSPDGTRLLFTSHLNYDQVRAALEKAGKPAAPAWPLERPGRKPNDTPGKASVPEKPEEVPLALADGSLTERRAWLAHDEEAGNPRVLTRLKFQNEGDIDPVLSFQHVFTLELREGAEPVDLTPGYTDFQNPEWLADGKGIVASGPAKLEENPDRSLAGSLYRIDPAGGGATLLAELKDYSLGGPVPSPDGKLIALTATPGEVFGYGQTAVATIPVAGGAPKLLTEKLDRTAGNLKWSPDSAQIYFVAPSNGAFPLYRVAAATGKTDRLTAAADFGVRDYAVGAERVSFVQTTPKDPSALVIGRPGQAGTTTLAAPNQAWIAGKALSAYEPHSFVNQEGLTIDYWFLKPVPFDDKKPHPLLLEIHGGPAAMWGPGEDSMWFEFQYFAARGYAIVFANPRGSGGYGYEFQHANHKDWGIGPAGDVLSAVDFAVKEPGVDKQALVLTGGSYGGYLTAWIVGHDHRFKAAVAQRGVYDLATFFGEGNAWRLVPIVYDGYPWQPQTRRILERESPITYVEAITTPLLIQHGDNDRRTGFVQSEMLLRSLKLLGRDVESVRYPRATHEMSRAGEPRQRLDSLIRYDEFFRRYLGAEAR